MLFIHYPKCSTCQKARAWLVEHLTLEELREWQRRSGLPLKRFFNTSGMLYRDLGLKDKLPGMSEEEQLALLSSDGMLVKRPLLITDKTALPGFREKEWEAAL